MPARIAPISRPHVAGVALFPAGRALAPFEQGFAYQPDFLSVDEERELLGHIRSLALTNAQYKAFQARRRVASYGGRYDYDKNQLDPAAPIPEFLHPLRERVGRWAGHDPADYTHALIAEYAEGVQLGWHRDVPDFERIVGVSLLSACRMRFRRYPPGPREIDRPGAGAALGLSHGRRGALGLAAQRAARSGASLFDNVSHAAEALTRRCGYSHC